LGCVYFDGKGKAEWVFGGNAVPYDYSVESDQDYEKLIAARVPPNSSLFREDELRRLLRLIDTAPELSGDYYNPLPIIQIVNELQSLGKTKALAAVDEYLRVAPFPLFPRKAREGLAAVLSVLFDVGEERSSLQIVTGGTWPVGPTDCGPVPLFPIV